FRSGIGSRLAVDVAATVILEALAHLDGVDVRTTMQVLPEQLSRNLVQCWQENVKLHIAEHPFTLAETETWRGKDIDQRPIDMTPNHLLPYGTTLLAVAATPALILYLQLGDGDIL